MDLRPARAGHPSINLADGPVGVRIDPVPSAAAQVVYDEAGVPVAALAGEPSRGPDPLLHLLPSTTALAATWDSGAARLQGRRWAAKPAPTAST